MSRKFLLFLGVSALLMTTGCDAGFQKMEAGEYGVVFVALPPMIGGGVRDSVIDPGEMEFIFPWEELYRIDTTLQSLSWGNKGSGKDSEIADSVQTRTVDGNEVGLAITVQYHVDPTMVSHLVQNVATTEERLRALVAAVAGADIRTHMNTLSTRDFFTQKRRQEAVDRVRESMNARLGPEGIIVDSVIYNDHRFERLLADGTVDDSYQQRIDQTQTTNQETEQERKRIATVVEQKKIEFNEVLAVVNRELAEAEGRKQEAVFKGDSYLKAKSLEAEQIRNVGKEELEGLTKRIEALSGPGGEAMLKLELVHYLMKSNPKFVLLNSSAQGQGIDVNRMDTNELLRQIGVTVGVQDSAKQPVSGNQIPESDISGKSSEKPASAPQN